MTKPPLTRREAKKLLAAPDIAEVGGMRDKAILALLIGTGMHRAEVAELQVNQIQRNRVTVTRDGKLQTVLMPEWVKHTLDEYRKAAKIKDGAVLRAINQWGHMRDRMTDRAVYGVVTQYADKLGLEITPSSLRRTFAQLAYDAGADIHEIAAALGHSSTKATREMLGLSGEQTQRSKTAPGDRLALT
ncbi:MAG: site-specific integrase [Acidobacteriota bacterium]|nr:site-specific integrase [Acidobacteriota bacterium]